MKLYENQIVEVINGVVATNTQTGKRAEGTDIVSISFTEIPKNVVSELIKEGDSLHCAGGLQAEHPALQPYIKSLNGTRESLHGVPIELTQKLIRKVN